jgi:hypothetical protein
MQTALAPDLTVAPAWPPVGIEHYIVPGTGGHGQARADALLAVIDAFGCRTAVFGYDSAPGDTFLIMTGTRPMLDALELLLPRIATEMEQSARTYARRGRRSSFRDYLRGYGEGAADEFRALRGWMVRNDWDLADAVATSTLRIEEEFTRRFPDKQSVRRETVRDSLAREAGLRAGQAAGVGDPYLAIHDLVFAGL